MARSNDVKVQARDRYYKGESLEAIGTALGTPVRTLYRWARAEKWTANRKESEGITHVEILRIMKKLLLNKATEILEGRSQDLDGLHKLELDVWQMEDRLKRPELLLELAEQMAVWTATNVPEVEREIVARATEAFINDLRGAVT